MSERLFWYRLFKLVLAFYFLEEFEHSRLFHYLLFGFEGSMFVAVLFPCF